MGSKPFKDCPSCGGSGVGKTDRFDTGAMKECKTCEGAGSNYRIRHTTNNCSGKVCKKAGHPKRYDQGCKECSEGK